MAVEFTCPACAGTLRAADGPVGRVVRCGGCLALLKVPDAPPVPEPEPPSRPPPVRRRSVELPAEDGAADEPPAIRGAGFWVAVTLFAVVIGAFGCCGLAAVLLPDPEWQPHVSVRGGFRVELPAPPRPDMAGRVRAAKGQTVEGTNLRTRAESYTITYWDITPTRQRANTKPDEQWLDDQVKVLTSDPDIKKVLRTEPVEVSGFPGREFEYRYENGGTFTGRVIVADSRAYVLLAGGRFTRPGSENARHFLDSFEITDPKLLAVAKERADEAARRKKKE